MAKQLEFKKVKGWGGKRQGAGRKNRSGIKGHTKRERIDINKPMHVTLKFKRAALRNKTTFKAFKKAVQEAKRFCLYVVHYSVQYDHVHMIVEAKDNKSLSRGMKSLCGRFGKIVRVALGGRGPVFKGRYDVTVLENPTMMKRALEYVLANSAKHMKVFEHVDDFSSGWAFKEWRKLLGERYSEFIHDQLKGVGLDFPEITHPQSWLARLGWMRAVK